MTVAALLAIVSAAFASAVVFLTPLLIPALKAFILGAVNGIATRLTRGRKR